MGIKDGFYGFLYFDDIKTQIKTTVYIFCQDIWLNILAIFDF